MSATQIGTIEILQPRVYPLDAESSDPSPTEVIVQPGSYELYRDGDVTYWLMRGQINQRGLWREGDGMFVATASDKPSAIEVVFPSRRFGPGEWAKLIAGVEFAEGSAKQRLRLSLAVDR